MWGRTKHEWSLWENACVFDKNGRGILIQTSKCALTGKIRIRRVKLGWVNDYRALAEIRKSLGL